MLIILLYVFVHSKICAITVIFGCYSVSRRQIYKCSGNRALVLMVNGLYTLVVPNL